MLRTYDMKKRLVEMVDRTNKVSRWVYIYKCSCIVCKSYYWSNVPGEGMCLRCDDENTRCELESINPSPYGTPSPDYKEYIKSDLWKGKAKAAKDRVGWRCQLCNKVGTETTLHVHHRTYDRLGVELAQDLIVLCKDCHAKFHGKDV